MPNRRTFLAALAAACATEPLMPTPQVYELRNYLLHPGQRDVLIELFEREFIEPQEALGMCVAGTFRDLDEADRFVWIRGFADFESRPAALGGFYTGPVWQTHRAAANATMIDSENVLLLRPHRGTLACAGERPPVGATALPDSVYVSTAWFLPPGGEAEFAEFFSGDIAPRLRDSGGAVIASFVSETRANNFPRLPVRENVNAFVALSRFPSLAAQTDSAGALGVIGREIERRLAQPAETARLQPTARSLLR